MRLLFKALQNVNVLAQRHPSYLPPSPVHCPFGTTRTMHDLPSKRFCATGGKTRVR